MENGGHLLHSLNFIVTDEWHPHVDMRRVLYMRGGETVASFLVLLPAPSKASDVRGSTIFLFAHNLPYLYTTLLELLGWRRAYLCPSSIHYTISPTFFHPADFSLLPDIVYHVRRTYRSQYYFLVRYSCFRFCRIACTPCRSILHTYPSNSLIYGLACVSAG